MKENITLY